MHRDVRASRDPGVRQGPCAQHHSLPGPRLSRPFGASTSAAEVVEGVDLAGTVAVVTGATGGIGLETARALAGAGARVVVAGRDRARGEASVRTLLDAVPAAAVELAVVDLADLASVRACGDDLLRRLPALHLLVNNAGVMACPEGRTADGFELQLGTNHLGHFALTLRLLPLLLASAPARVVNVSSHGHVRSGVDLDDPNYERRPYDKWEAYGQSKSANILFTLELERRLAGHGVHAFAVHPGMVATDLGRHLTRDDVKAVMKRATDSGRAGGGPSMSLKQVDTGAATTVWAAVAPELHGRGGSYLADCGVAEAAAHATDVEVARRLWELSEQLTGERLER